MILKALKYKSSWLGDWSIVSGTTNDEFVAFENINLIVGRNASGKTRVIKALRRISDLVGIDLQQTFFKEEETSFELKLEDKEDSIEYKFSHNESNIICETLIINGEEKIDREKGKIFYESIQQTLDFKFADDVLAVTRVDSIQHPFLKGINDWGKNLSHYSFGGTMGKDYRVKWSINDDENKPKLSFKDSNTIREVYAEGNAIFKEKFKENIVKDMESIEYFFDDISVEKINHSQSYILKVQESDLPNETYFESMSQGMARTFSLIVQLNYSLMAKIPSCILIDDIGEGLDYDRSKKLIELIIEKAEGSNIQVFMTTNDRFVMNSVPLKYWSVIHRESNKSVFYNYQNSKQTFDDFAFTGLNNFDFFATEFYRQGFEEFIATAQ